MSGTVTRVCTSTFTLPANTGRFVSDVGTYANIKEFAAGGVLTIEWVDGGGRTVVSIRCTASRVSLDGLTDATRAQCDKPVIVRPTYQPGVQSARITAIVSPGGCPVSVCHFHGRLSLAEAGDIL